MSDEANSEPLPPEVLSYHDHLNEPVSEKMVVKDAIGADQLSDLSHVATFGSYPGLYMITSLRCARRKRIKGDEPVVVSNCGSSYFHSESIGNRVETFSKIRTSERFSEDSQL